MLRNKIIVKKIRNIFILLMAIIIMIGAYHNIRNSKAENVIQIELEVADKSGILSAQNITVDATETSDGNYLLNLPISVNKNIVTKYYTSSGEEILIDSVNEENNVATIQLTDEEVQNKKVQVQTDYDTKEVTANGEKKLFYKKELTNEVVEDEQNGTTNSGTATTQGEATEVNQDVIVTGYMPEDAKLEVKEIDLATLTSVKVPNEEQTMKKAYEFSIYQIVEKQSTENETSNIEQVNENVDIADEETTTETSESTTEESNPIEKVEYDPSVYGENITVQTKYDSTDVNTIVYELEENNRVKEVESTVSENKEYVNFETEKTDKAIKYIIATQEKQEDDVNEDDNKIEDNTINNETTTLPNEIKNANWKIIESTPNIPKGIATVKIKGSEDILTEEWINVIINGEIVDEGITKKIENKEKQSDGVLYTVKLTDLPTETYQMKIGLVNPYSVGIQTLAMDEDTTNSTSDDSGIMLLETTYNTLRSTATESAANDGFLGKERYELARREIENIIFEESIPKTVYDNTYGRYIDSTAWDVSEAKDKSIIAWYETSNSNGAKKVHIGSNGTIYANQDSSHLFSSIGSSSICTATETITNLKLLNVSNVTNMSDMFYSCGSQAMTSLDLGNNFDTSNVTNINAMFYGCGSQAMTSLKLGNKFDTSNVTDMFYLFGIKTTLKTIDLGAAFSFAKANEISQLFYINSDDEVTIYAPEKIYKNSYKFRLNDNGDSYNTGDNIKIILKYRPEWTVTGTTIDPTNKAIKITINGATNDYTSNVTTALKTSDISVWIDGTELTGITKSLTTPSVTTASSITHTLTIKNFEESARKSGKSYKEWSGNITLKIEGRGEATSTYTKNVLTDSYGNQSMSATDESGTWVNVDFKDATISSTNESGKLFADVIKPEFTYEYANTIIDHGNKKVTVVFDVADKYFNSSTLEEDTTASQITVSVDGNIATKATKQLEKISDITATIDGKENTKVGEKYQLVITDLDQGDGGEYSGIMTLAFPVNTITDKSGNGSIAKTITIGIDDPTSGDGHNSGVTVDFIPPVWKTQNINIDNTNKKVTVDLIATDKSLNGVSNSSLTTSKISIEVDGEKTNTAITKSLSDPIFSENNETGLKEIKYTLTLTNWEQITKKYGKSFFEYSGMTNIIIDKGTIIDQYRNTNQEQKLEIGDVDFIKPKIEKVSSSIDANSNTGTMIFNVIDKYLDTSKEITANEITVNIDGKETTTVSKTLIRLTENDVSATINETSQTVLQQYKLVLTNFDKSVTSEGSNNVISIDISADVVKDKIRNGKVNTNEKTTLVFGEDDNDNIKPVWERVGIPENDVLNGTSSIVIIGSDENLSSYSLNTNNIKVIVNGKERTNGINVEVVEDTSVTLTNAVQYKVKVTGFESGADQVKIIVEEGTLVDNNQNTNEETGFVLYSTLKPRENMDTFLGNGDIDRGKIEKIILQDSFEGVNDTKWDASARDDGSIIAWYETTSRGTYKVYVGSYTGINANENSSFMFDGIGEDYLCAVTGDIGATDGTEKPLIENIELLNVEAVTNMNGMFENFGTASMKSFSLGRNFKTTNVENMGSMFLACGRNSMISLDLGDNFDTSNVTNMSYMFNICGYEKMTSLDLGDKFNTSQVTDMSQMFLGCGYQAMTSLNLGDEFNTCNVEYMPEMFKECGFEALTSLNLGNKFDTSNVTYMPEMFRACGHRSLKSLDLGNKFDTSNVGSRGMDGFFYECGFMSLEALDLGPLFQIRSDSDTYFEDISRGEWDGHGVATVIYAPESIFVDETHYKTINGTEMEVQYGTIINPIYRPEFTKVSSQLVGNNARVIVVKGTANKNFWVNGVNINYSSDLIYDYEFQPDNLQAEDVKVYIDGDDGVNDYVNKQISYDTYTNEETGKTEVEYSIYIDGFENSRLIGEDGYEQPFTEWSGNIGLQFTSGKLKDSTGEINGSEGNKNLGEYIDASGETQPILTKEDKLYESNTYQKYVEEWDDYEETDDVMFIDGINPEFTYEYANTTIDHEKQKVTIVFDVADKYFKESKLLTDPTASLITVSTGGVVATNATKTLTKISDLTDTINGIENKKIGERYQLEITNLDQGGGSDYSGIMKLSFPAKTVIDKSNNPSLPQTITIGIDDPAMDENHETGVVVDVVPPVWKVENVKSNPMNESVTLDLIATDKYLTGVSNSTLTTDDITLTVDGDGNANSIIQKTLSEPTFSTNSETGLKEIKYTLTLTNWEEDSKQPNKKYLEYSGIAQITIAEGTVTDDTSVTTDGKSDGKSNKSKRQTLSLGTVDVIKPEIENEKGSVSVDFDAKTATFRFNVIDKYLGTSNALNANNIKVYVNGTESSSVTKILSRVSENDVSETINGTERVVISQQYSLTLKGFDSSASQVKIQISDGAIADENGNNNKATDLIVFSKLISTSQEGSQSGKFLGNEEIQRQNIENITFESNIPSTVYNARTDTYIDKTAWDVSAKQDKSIIAWYEKNNDTGVLKVHIGSNGAICANENSSNLFEYIGFAEICTATETITNIELLDVSRVTDMSSMFRFCGYRSMTSFNLGTKFNTSKVTNMSNMFEAFGYKAVRSLNLGDGFNTSKVTNMYYMFEHCGYNSMESLNLGGNFDTSEVTDMNMMFAYCGNDKLEGLDLGNKFNTGKVTDMSSMFSHLGAEKLSSLNLGSNFNTSKVTNMKYMFNSCGDKELTSLDLGENFDTSSVTNMSFMFNYLRTCKNDKLKLRK